MTSTNAKIESNDYVENKDVNVNLIEEQTEIS